MTSTPQEEYYLSVHKYEILESILKRLEDNTSMHNYLLEQIDNKEYSEIEQIDKNTIIEQNNQIIKDIEYMNKLIQLDYRKY